MAPIEDTNDPFGVRVGFPICFRDLFFQDMFVPRNFRIKVLLPPLDFGEGAISVETVIATFLQEWGGSFPKVTSQFIGPTLIDADPHPAEQKSPPRTEEIVLNFFENLDLPQQPPF